MQRAAFALALLAALLAQGLAMPPGDNDGEPNNAFEWLHPGAFEAEGLRRSQRRAINSEVADGVSISVSPTTISHCGQVTVTFSNTGSTVLPQPDDWVACYTPADSDITKTVPARWQLANWTGSWFSSGAETSLKFKLNNFHYDYACYLFNGGLNGAPKTKSQAIDSDMAQDTGAPPGAKPFLSVKYANRSGVFPDFRVLAGPSETISFDKPNLPTHVRVTPGAATSEAIAMSISWNQKKESTGGAVKITSTSGDYTAATSVPATSFVIDMSTDVCSGGPAGSTWGFRDMARTWQAKGIDMTAHAGKTLYYKVGDSTDWSDEYALHVPPLAGSTDNISIIAFADQGVGYTDDSFNGRDYNNGIAALGVATQVANDVATGKYSAVLIGGDLSYSDGYLTVWEDWFDQMEPAISHVPCLVGDGNHESNWFNSDGIGKTGFGAAVGNLIPPQVCKNTTKCPETGTYTTEPPTDTWGKVRSKAYQNGNEPGITLGYMGPGFSQWSGSSSGGECGLIYSLMPHPGTSVGAGASDRTWWSVAYGPLFIIHYSTERDMSWDSAQYQWLVSTLQSIDRTVTPWVIAIGHRSIYVDTASSKDLDIMLYYQSKLDKLFTDHGVNLVLAGHTHVTQRHCANFLGSSTMCSVEEGPVHVYRNPKNPVYMNIGNAGASADYAGVGPLGCDFTDWSTPRPAYTRINIKGQRLSVEYVDALNGDILDRSAIDMPCQKYAEKKNGDCVCKFGVESPGVGSRPSVCRAGVHIRIRAITP